MSGYGEVGLTCAFYCTELLGSPESNKKERRGKTGDIRWNDKSSYFTYLRSEDYPEFTLQFDFFFFKGPCIFYSLHQIMPYFWLIDERMNPSESDMQ